MEWTDGEEEISEKGRAVLGGAVAFCAAWLYVAGILTQRAGGVSPPTALVVSLKIAALVLLVLAMAVWFVRQRHIIDPAQRVYQTRYTFMSVPFNGSTHLIDSVVAVRIKRYRAPKGHIRCCLQIRRAEGALIDLTTLRNLDAAKHYAERIASLLRVDVEYTTLSASEAATMYRVLVFLSFALCVAAFVWFNMTHTPPLVNGLLRLSQYRKDALVQVPCRILSFEASRPEGGDEIWTTGSGVRISISRGTLVDVCFGYEYEGKHYESRKFGLFGNQAPEDVAYLPPGSQSVCYLYPGRPFEAVLNTSVQWRPIFSAVAVNSILLLFFVFACLLRRDFRRLYLGDRGWIEETVTDAEGSEAGGPC